MFQSVGGVCVFIFSRPSPPTPTFSLDFHLYKLTGPVEDDSFGVAWEVWQAVHLDIEAYAPPSQDKTAAPQNFKRLDVGFRKTENVLIKSCLADRILQYDMLRE